MSQMNAFVAGKTVAEVLRFYCEYVIVFTDGTGVLIGSPDHDMFSTELFHTSDVEEFRRKIAEARESYTGSLAHRLSCLDPDGMLENPVPANESAGSQAASPEAK